MTQAIKAASILYSTLKIGSLIFALAGVAVFGWYFVRANTRAARDVSEKNAGVSWGGNGAKIGVRVLVFGLLLQLPAFLLVVVLPSRL
jgi:hypothetical protein